MSDSNSKNAIPLSVPEISGNEWKYVKDCLDTGWVSSVGDYVDQFEKMVAEYVGSKYAVAVVNGTSALHISLIVCGVMPNDEVIVPTLTFIAPVNTIRYCGAEPVFMDCNPDTLCIDVGKFEEFIADNTFQKDDGYAYNKNTGRRIKAVIPVHIFGHPVDMEKLLEISQKYNIDVIEDATESLGSLYKGRKTGSFGKLGCFSFNGNKIITTGGGGMITTDDENLAKRAKHLTTQAKSDFFEYDHNEIGYNYRLTNLQAAVGVAQMERINEFVDQKRKNANIYRELLSDIEDVEFLWEKPWVKSNFWFYTIKVSTSHRKPLMEYLLKRNIQVRPVWKLIHTLPMYRGFQAYEIKNAEEAYKRCFNLPCSSGLKEAEVEFVVSCIKDYFSRQSI